MARDVRERKCGCLYFQFGPPVKCPRHLKKARLKEEKTLRALVEEQATNLGHEVTEWREYKNQRGKWTAYCKRCGLMAIVYDEPPVVGDQVGGWLISRGECKKSDLATLDIPVEDLPEDEEDEEDDDGEDAEVE
jgi:hypothetical protein